MYFVQEVDESLGLADKLHLVKQVAQTVQVSVACTRWQYMASGAHSELCLLVLRTWQVLYRTRWKSYGSELNHHLFSTLRQLPLCLHFVLHLTFPFSLLCSLHLPLSFHSPFLPPSLPTSPLPPLIFYPCVVKSHTRVHTRGESLGMRLPSLHFPPSLLPPLLPSLLPPV